MCIVCVCLLCIWCSYGKRRLWVSPFISSLITVPTGKAAQKSLSNANALSLVAHNMKRLAVSHSPFTVYLPHLQLPAPNAHTTCSSDCLPGKPDSGQLIFSSTHQLINTKTPHYTGLMQNCGKLVRHVTIQATFSSLQFYLHLKPIISLLFYLFLAFIFLTSNKLVRQPEVGEPEHIEHANRLSVLGAFKAHRAFGWEGLCQFV